MHTYFLSNRPKCRQSERSLSRNTSVFWASCAGLSQLSSYLLQWQRWPSGPCLIFLRWAKSSMFRDHEQSVELIILFHSPHYSGIQGPKHQSFEVGWYGRDERPAPKESKEISLIALQAIKNVRLRKTAENDEFIIMRFIWYFQILSISLFLLSFYYI